MELINASIPCDLSAAGIAEGLKVLGSTDLTHIRLLAAIYENFQTFYHIICQESFLNGEQFSFANIDTTEILKRYSWMLIDYEQEKIYYSPGA